MTEPTIDREKCAGPTENFNAIFRRRNYFYTVAQTRNILRFTRANNKEGRMPR